MRPRFDVNDVELAEFALKELFHRDLRNRLFIVVTFAEDACEDKDTEWEWIRRNAKVDDEKKHQASRRSIFARKSKKDYDNDKLFSAYFDLVDGNRDRIVFVNNKDPTNCKTYVHSIMRSHTVNLLYLMIRRHSF